MNRLRPSLLVLPLLLAGAALPAQEKGDAPRLPPSTSSIVQGLEIYLDRDGEVIPGPVVEVDAREKYITIRARAGKWKGKDGEITDWKLDRVEYVIVTVGAVPVKFTEDLDPANASLIAGLPDAGEGALIYACATLVREGQSGPQRAMTRHALLTVRVTGKLTGKSPTPLEAPVAVPAGVTGLAVVIVSRDEKAPQELQDLVKSERVKAELAKSKSAAYLYAAAELARRSDIAAVMKDAQGKELPGPALVVISADGKQVLPSGRASRLVFLRYDGKTDKDSLTRNEAILLDSVGRAAGGK